MSEYALSSETPNFTDPTNVTDPPPYQPDDDDVFAGLNIPYTICEILVAVCAVVGNALVILVFRKERRLRRRTNYYIISLAVADLLVGLLGIPFAILASVGLPTNLYACLFTISLLVVLCTISIFCLVAVSVDRYWAILHPMAYSRNVRTKTTIGIIGLCWFSGSVIGFLPLFGWHGTADLHQKCMFTDVMSYSFLVFLYFATIIFPALLLVAFYAHIYQVVLKQLRQIVTMNPTSNSGGVTRSANGGTMLRVFGAAQKREVKATKNLGIIVFFFIICWIPLYTINCVKAFCPDCYVSLTLTNCCIILTHFNSAGNPLLYAYHLRDFRAALKNLLCGIFGVKDEVTVYHGPRASIGSTLHHPGAYNSRNNSVQSLRDINQLKIAGYADFKVANSCLTTLPPLITDLQPKMWTLTEVPSICEDDLSNSARRVSGTPVRLRSVIAKNRNDGKLNSAYSGDPGELDEDDDDDVFVVESEMPPPSIIAALNELPFRHSSFASVWERGTSLRRDEVSAPPDEKRRSTSSEGVTETNTSQVIVEAEINSQQIDAGDKTELSSSDGTTPVITGNGDLKKDINQVEADDKQCKRSPLKQLRMSPLKYVGDLFFHSSNKSVNETVKGDEQDCDKTSINHRRNGSMRVRDNTLKQSDDSSAVT